jgi:ribosomal protein S18 acetylase RimI-like enzyme
MQDNPAMKLVTIGPGDTELLQQFLETAGDSLRSFRYFQKRSFSVLENHLYTVIGLVEDEPAAYGHLDQEVGITWLGIAVAERFRGQGLGRQMMQVLVDKGRELKLDTIRLAVDQDNPVAIRLYKHFSFRLIEDKGAVGIYQLARS